MTTKNSGGTSASMDTSTKTIDVPNVPAANPAVVAALSNTGFQRVLVRNVGAVDILLATEIGAVQEQASPTAAFILPPGMSEAIPLNIGQQLYGVGVGPGGRISVVRSAAIPAHFIGG